MRAKPFLKWAGGKTQLIEQIKNQIPSNIRNKNFTYIEPFVGSGAILFWLLEKYPNLERAVINDINSDLINTYLTIKNDVNKLIVILKNWEKEYHSKYNDKESAKKYYYEKRDLFNSRCSDNTTQGHCLYSSIKHVLMGCTELIVKIFLTFRLEKLPPYLQFATKKIF